MPVTKIVTLLNDSTQRIAHCPFKNRSVLRSQWRLARIRLDLPSPQAQRRAALRRTLSARERRDFTYPAVGRPVPAMSQPPSPCVDPIGPRHPVVIVRRCAHAAAVSESCQDLLCGGNCRLYTVEIPLAVAHATTERNPRVIAVGQTGRRPITQVRIPELGVPRALAAEGG